MMTHAAAAKDGRIWRLRNLPLSAFTCGVFTITWDRVAVLDLGGFTFRLSQGAFLAALLLLALVIPRSFRGIVQHLRSGFALSIIGLAAFFLISSLRSYFPLKSALYSIWLLFNLGAIWLCAQLLPHAHEPKWITRAVAGSLLLNAVVILIDQFAFSFGYPNGLIGFNQFSESGAGLSRPHAFAYEPSYIALNIGLSLALFLPHLFEKRWSYWILSGIGLVALVATTSRSGLLSFALIGLVFTATNSIRKKKFPWQPAFLAVVSGLSALAYSALVVPEEQRQKVISNLISSVRDGSDGSLNARWRTNLLAPQLAAESDWLGVGLGASFRYIMDHKHSIDTVLVSDSEKASKGAELIPSTWGQLLAEGGIIAVLLYLAAGLFLIARLWRAWIATEDMLVLAALSSATVWFFAITFWIGNIARGDVWIWFAIWSFTALNAERGLAESKLAAEASK